jgi:chorismate synthase
MGSSTGLLFRVTTFGESHGGAIGAVVEGCPPRLALDLHAIQRELDRRKPGQSSITTQRKESDRVQVLSGLADGLTLGTPIALLIPNEDADSRAYEPFRDKYRLSI